MNRRLLFLPTAALSAAVVMAACSGAVATQAPTSGAGATPAAGTPAAIVPTLPPGTFAVPPGSFVLPTMPSFQPDTALESAFPKTIAGSPVKNLSSARFYDFLKAFGTKDADLAKSGQALAAVGIDLTTLALASGSYDINGSSKTLTALRAPGRSATIFIENYAVLAGAFGSTTVVPTLTQANVGGKAVTVATSTGGSTQYLYPQGEILWDAGTDPESAATLLSALP